MSESQPPSLPADPKPAGRESEQPAINPRLLEILVCPVTRTTLEYDKNRQELVSRKAGLAFPIRDGIPIMLPDEARKVEA